MRILRTRNLGHNTSFEAIAVCEDKDNGCKGALGQIQLWRGRPFDGPSFLGPQNCHSPSLAMLPVEAVLIFGRLAEFPGRGAATFLELGSHRLHTRTAIQSGRTRRHCSALDVAVGLGLHVVRPRRLRRHLRLIRKQQSCDPHGHGFVLKQADRTGMLNLADWTIS